MEPGYVIRERYQLEEIAGKGGMAVVWRATQRGDVGFKRTVAIKQMHDHLADRQLYVDMFAEEARVAANLEGPNLVQIFDFLAEEGRYYLVMEWIEGIDLGSYIRYCVEKGVQTRWELVTAIGIGVLRALAAAHERETAEGELAPVVHRDVSPHNILMTTRGIVKLIDFGLSFARDRTKELTEPGIVKGKMSYLSPEIVSGERPTPSADVFAVGSVLWEALVGRKLFDGQNDFDVYTKLRNAQVQPLRPLRRDIPRNLVSLIHKALGPREQDRFTSAREMATHLGQVLKSARSRKDLHQLLGRTVMEAREYLDMGRMTGAGDSTTPIADLESFGDTPLPVDPETIVDKQEIPVEDNKRGLLHKIPFFGRRRRR